MKKSLQISMGILGSLSLVGASSFLVIDNNHIANHTTTKTSKAIPSNLFQKSNFSTTSSSATNGMIWNLNWFVLIGQNNINGNTLTTAPWQNGSTLYNSNYDMDMSNLKVPYEGQMVPIKMISANWLVQNLTNNMLASLLEQSIGILDSSFANQSGYLTVSNLKVTQITDTEINNYNKDLASINGGVAQDYNPSVVDASSSQVLSNPNLPTTSANLKGYYTQYNNSVNITYDLTWNNSQLEQQFNKSNISQYYSFGNLTINDLAVDASAASNALWNSITNKNDTLNINLTGQNSAFLQDFYQLQGWLFNSSDWTADNYSSITTNIDVYLDNVLFQPTDILNNPQNLPYFNLINPNFNIAATTDNNLSSITTSFITNGEAGNISSMPFYFVFGNNYWLPPLGAVSNPSNGYFAPFSSTDPTYLEFTNDGSGFASIPFKSDSTLPSNLSDITYNVYYTAGGPNGQTLLYTQKSNSTTWNWTPTFSQWDDLNSNSTTSNLGSIGSYGNVTVIPVILELSAMDNTTKKIVTYQDTVNIVTSQSQVENGIITDNISSFINPNDTQTLPNITLSNLDYIDDNTSSIYNFEIDASTTNYKNDSPWDILNNKNITYDFSTYYKELDTQFNLSYQNAVASSINQQIFEDSKNPFNYIALNSPSSSQVTNAAAMTINFNATNSTYANRFIEIPNKLSNTLTFVTDNNTYQNLNLSNVPLDTLTEDLSGLTDITLPFDSMILYNLSGDYYIPNTIDINQTDVDLNNYTFEKLKSVSDATWDKIINTLIKNYYNNLINTSTYQLYKFTALNENLILDSNTKITLSQTGSNTYLNVPYINQNKNVLVINNIILDPNKTTIIPIQLLNVASQPTSTPTPSKPTTPTKNNLEWLSFLIIPLILLILIGLILGIKRYKNNKKNIDNQEIK